MTPATQQAPISMREAVGYDSLDCAHQAAVENALVLTHDRLFLLLDEHGNISPPGRCGLGLFHDDTRILSHYDLRFDVGEPDLLSAQVTAPFHALVDLALTDRSWAGDAWDPKNVVHVRREILLDDVLLERLSLTNYLTHAVEVELELRLGSDFVDIFEVRGWKRGERGDYHPPRPGARSLELSYRGRDGELLCTRVRFAAAPDHMEADRARWQLRLEPGVRTRLEWEVGLAEVEGTPPVTELGERCAGLEEEYLAWRGACSAWSTDVAEFDATLAQAVDDLRALYTHTGDEEIITAGIPWYSTAFGRDSLITSLQTLPLNPHVATDTLRYLARHQGEKEDAYTEEQPGRIMHELRRGEMARTGEIPHVPYFGTVDATPLWVVLLHETWRWTGDAELGRELLPNLERALAWIDRHGDLDGDGFVEYARTSERGLANQGWKDSGDGVPFPDGRLPEGPIALVEVQGYVYDAKRRAAQLVERLGDAAWAERLRAEAAALRARIHEHFWLEELGTFALALDGAKRPLPTVTTNAGHLLWSGVPTTEQAARMAALLTSAEMFSGWGIRTLSAAHPVYNPMSYHNGSIWPHDNALVALGLTLYGHADAALPVLGAMHDAAKHMRPPRLPELYCGMRRAGGRRPVQYPVSCSPQAWASGALFMLLQGVLGLHPEADRGVLHIRDPRLPPFLRELTLTGLQVGGTRVGLRFHRHGGRTLANLLLLEGDPLQVHIELS